MSDERPIAHLVDTFLGSCSCGWMLEPGAYSPVDVQAAHDSYVKAMQ